MDLDRQTFSIACIILTGSIFTAFLFFLGKPLPFGTLGKHKKAEFRDANVCLFVFDCIYYNGESLIQKPLSYRKKILQENMKEIPNRIMFSEMEEIHKPRDLAKMIAKVLKLGLEGLVLKDLRSIYEPGKRHWLKVKKDYLFEGAMADTADLIVLGAWYGTGKKGGMMSVFLMGCYNPNSKRFCTVTKVHTGHDDKTLEKLQDELEMEKISQDVSKVPKWLNCTKTMVPDFIAKDPKNQPVWEITGAEFTQHDVHTADGISIRFPRVTRIRSDKNWETATNLQELQQLYKNSKENTDVSLLTKGLEKNYDESEEDMPAKKKKHNDDENNSPRKENKELDKDDDRNESPVKKKKHRELEKNDSRSENDSPVKKKKDTNSKSPRKRQSDKINTTDEEDNESKNEPRMKRRKHTKKETLDKRKNEEKIEMDEDELPVEELNETISKKEYFDVEIINPLPHYFTDVKALIEDELKKDKHFELIR